MEAPLSLRLLYTSNLRGDIALLPRLYTFLQRLKTGDSRDTLLLDLGNACNDLVWHCQQTGGRSMLIVLDGMGYHAANIDGALDALNRERLAKQVTLALVDRTNDWRLRLQAKDDRYITATVNPNEDAPSLQVCLAPAEDCHVDGNVLYLRELQNGQVGSVIFDIGKSPRILAATIRDLPPDTPPNPSIAGAVEFVESEARLFQKKQSKSAE